jgi:predicted ester cyclase
MDGMGSNGDTVRAIEEAWDNGKLDELDQYFAPEFDNSQSIFMGLPAGLEGAKMAHQGSISSFPDRKIETLDLIEDGDQVLVRNRVTGTNQGGFPAFNVPANGKPIDIESWSAYTFKDGKVVRHVGINDGLTLLMQLGVLGG